eukprot:608842-Lingulodinium_polyedra.AAC.1
MPEPGARVISPARRGPSPSPLRGLLSRRRSGRAGLSNDSFHALCVSGACAGQLLPAQQAMKSVDQQTTATTTATPTQQIGGF